MNKQAEVVSVYENVKLLLPQLYTTFVAAASFIPLYGINFGFSAVIIEQLTDCAEGKTNCSDTMHPSRVENSWIASALTISIPIGAMISSTIMDHLGRLNLILLSAVPGTIGWVTIALSDNTFMIILGRIANGIAAGWCTCGAFVYISETTSPDVRGSMAGVASMLGALGIALTYVMGYIIHWRIIAWVTVGFTISSTVITKLIPESPVWLVSKGRIEEAETSLAWMYRYKTDSKMEIKEQLDTLTALHGSRKDTFDMSTIESIKFKLNMFLKPAVYKPLLMLPILNFLVQFSGVLVVVYHAVTIFKEAGTEINPFLASIYFGTARFSASLLAIALMRCFGRRTLLISSGLVMVACMVVSGTYTKWIQEGTTTCTWVPVAFITLYVAATMTGFVAISQSISAELFPTAVRGTAQSISMSILFGMSFASVYSFYKLNHLFGGSAGMQFFFAATALVSVIYCFIFIPETHKKSLHEIEKYFENNTLYVVYLFRSKKLTESTEEIVRA